MELNYNVSFLLKFILKVDLKNSLNFHYMNTLQQKLNCSMLLFSIALLHKIIFPTAETLNLQNHREIS